MALVSLTAASGCTARIRSDASDGEKRAPGATFRTRAGAPLPETVSLQQTLPPALDYREFELPPGAEIADRSQHMAVFRLDAPESPGHPSLGMLDLQTGRHRIVLRQAANAAAGFSMCNPRLSDTWLAWEEVSPAEEIDPGKADWRLYAAAIDTATLSVGTPRLVDEGRTDYKLRPHFAVARSGVYRSLNMRAGASQERFPRSGSIEALDLETGQKRTLARTSTSYPTLCLADDLLCLTESTDEHTYSVRAVLIDPESGRTSLTLDLANEHPLSHFVRASSEWLAWSTFSAPGDAWPVLYFAPRDGGPLASQRQTTRGPERARAASRGAPTDVMLAGIDSIDPAFFGRYVAFESVDASSAGAPGGVVRHLRRIWVADPAARTRSILLETADGGGWWQTCAAGVRTDALLVWNDLAPWVDDPSGAKTLVRVYRERE